jgi:hypothetical protein
LRRGEGGGKGEEREMEGKGEGEGVREKSRIGDILIEIIGVVPPGMKPNEVYMLFAYYTFNLLYLLLNYLFIYF